jgi:hypothetical protein
VPVRFSDMLSGSGEPDDARAAKSVYDALSDDFDADDEPEDDEADADDEPEAESPPAAERPPMPSVESPEEVLDRLTRYAKSARAAEPAEPPDEDAPGDDELPPVGDDFLPRPREIERKPGRSRKRRP